MLNLGFCYCLLPLIKTLRLGEAERRAFLQRHLEFFNAHPYFASFALGAVARLEEQHKTEKWPSARPISVLKNRLCGPLGAIGDRLFWGNFRPLIAMIAIYLTFLFGIWGPVFMLVAYNIAHLYLRYYGVVRGYQLGFDIVRELSKRKYEKYIQAIGKVGAVACGMLIGFYEMAGVKRGDFLGPVLFAFTMAISFIFIRLRKPVLLPILLCIGLLITALVGIGRM